MEAKDIVANEVARQAEFGYEPSWLDFVIAGQMAGYSECDAKWLPIINKIREENKKAGKQEGYRDGLGNGKTLGRAIGIRSVVEWLERAKKIKVPKYQLKEWGIE